MKAKSMKSKMPKCSFPYEAKATKLQDRKLLATNPLQEQFEPTTSEPVRQHARMAGQ